MKVFKIFAVLAVAAILLAPAAAHARGPKFSFSVNIMDAFLPPPPVPVYVPCPPPPPPVIVERYPVFVERQPVFIERQPIYVEQEQRVVREHHYSCQCPECYAEELKPSCHCGRGR